MSVFYTHQFFFFFTLGIILVTLDKNEDLQDRTYQYHLRSISLLYFNLIEKKVHEYLGLIPSTTLVGE